MLVTIATRDMFGKIERDEVTGLFTCPRLIRPGVTTMKDVENMDIYWWDQAPDQDPIPGYSVFKVKEDGTLVLMYETPDKVGV